MTLSMNDKCRVQLTTHGLKTYVQHYERLGCPWEQLKEFEDGALTTELWYLFAIFGRSIYMGGDIPFERNEVEVLSR